MHATRQRRLRPPFFRDLPALKGSGGNLETRPCSRNWRLQRGGGAETHRDETQYVTRTTALMKKADDVTGPVSYILFETARAGGVAVAVYRGAPCLTLVADGSRANTLCRKRGPDRGGSTRQLSVTFTPSPIQPGLCPPRPPLLISSRLPHHTTLR